MGELKQLQVESVKVVTGETLLPCLLTEAERLQLGDDMAEIDRRAGELEYQAESLKEQARSLLKQAEPLREEGKVLAATWRRGMVDREIEVEKRVDYAAGLVSYTRTDTGEVYRTREILPAERQMSLVDAD